MTLPLEPKNKPESIVLLEALLARSQPAADIAQAFHQMYPEAPQAMIDTAVFHVATDGIEATVDWLAAIEKFIRNPAEGLDHGAVWHVVYHLYNWLQFQALLPLGRLDLKERLGDVRMLVEEGATAEAIKVLNRLTEALNGVADTPAI